MFGGVYFGQGFFGGDSGDDAGAIPPSGAVLAADAASATDFDANAVGVGASDEIGTATESATATGLGVAASNKAVTDSGHGTESAVASGLNTVPPPPPPNVVHSVFRFVDSCSITAGVRMDLENAYWRVLFDGTDAPPPAARDQRADSMLTDGSLITGTVYENRQVTLALQLKAPNAVAATEIQKLQRELDRADNVLWWQPDTDLPPQFIRTYRCPDVEENLDWGIGLHHFTLHIEAEPLGIGEPVTRAVTMFSDPNAPTNPCWVEFSDVLGDVDTPLYITSTDTDLSGRKVALSTRRRGDPSAVTWFRQAEDTGLTLGADATRIAGAGTSGTSMVHVTFTTTPANAVRLSGLFPADAGGTTDWRGAYRVMARMKLNNGLIKVQVATGTTVASRNQQVTLDDSTTWMWYDLGVVNLPVGNVGRRAGYGAEYPAGPSTLRLYAEQQSAGTFDIDVIFLMPADETYALAQLPVMSAAGSGVALDGIAGDVYYLTAAGELAGTSGAFIPYPDGQLPTLSPLAATNRLFIIAGITGGNRSEVTIGSSYTLNVTYWPLYRVVRPVST